MDVVGDGEGMPWRRLEVVPCYRLRSRHRICSLQQRQIHYFNLLIPLLTYIYTYKYDFSYMVEEEGEEIKGEEGEEEEADGSEEWERR